MLLTCRCTFTDARSSRQEGGESLSRAELVESALPDVVKGVESFKNDEEHSADFAYQVRCDCSFYPPPTHNHCFPAMAMEQQSCFVGQVWGSTALHHDHASISRLQRRSGFGLIGLEGLGGV